MERPSSRLAAFIAWKGWAQTEAATRLEMHQASLSQLLNEKRWPGRRVANAIEHLTARWSKGPIRSVEWDAVEPKQAPKRKTRAQRAA